MRHRHYTILAIFICAVVLTVGIIVAMKSGGGTAGQNLLDSRFKCSARGASAENRVPVTGLNSTGSVDDFTPIQRAIDIAGRLGGGVVDLPAGTFLIDSHLILRNNVKLIGVGPATVIKAGPGFLSTQGPGGGYPMITTAGATDVTIGDLTADQNGGTLDGAVAARLADYVVEARNSSNIVIDEVNVRNPFTYSIAVVRSMNFCVEKCHTTAATSERYNQLDGIHILDSSWGQVIYNVVQAGEDGLVAHTIGAPVHNIVYAGNDVSAGINSAGMQLAIGNFPIYNISVVDNNFHGSLYGIRTGYYDGRNGAFYNILISQNYIHGLSRGQRFPAIEIGGFGGIGLIRNVRIADNSTCAAGSITVPTGSGDVVTGTTVCYTKLPAMSLRRP